MPVDKSAPLGLGALFGQLDAVAIVANIMLDLAAYAGWH
ncbi:hypothetical protein CTAM01_09095 [Colletotrichum tamarilloi]|uniref:Uncharacterized protein n=1 Tax=Colletotrichum tamarilloi TaxID=1209934 RepID=A0ABQ9R4B6_9PEZI|nr:uncharacterized protein CTAM01_09095 [Colletotrichum tamarilloi]KAK1494214.1 hypothetical protein CTAM01_09095 [Colletotrichum tamarilloi]